MPIISTPGRLWQEGWAELTSIVIYMASVRPARILRQKGRRVKTGRQNNTAKQTVSRCFCAKVARSWG